MIDSVIVGDLDENCYMLYNDNSDECILIDPGAEADRIQEMCDKAHKTPKYILLTHGHFDHIGAAKHFQDMGAKVYVHEDDYKKIQYDRVAVMFGIENIEWLTADEIVHDGDILDILGYKIEVIHTPGHSKGAVCYVVDDEKCMFVGDTVFFRSYGRYDFPDGSLRELVASFKKLFTLEGKDDYILYPGHGISTTLGDEKIGNMIRTQM